MMLLRLITDDGDTVYVQHADGPLGNMGCLSLVVTVDGARVEVVLSQRQAAEIANAFLPPDGSEAPKVDTHHTYLGDGVYVQLAPEGVELTTGDGRTTTNRIVLEPEVVATLERWIAKRRATRA
jgi:hypothetical protein